MPAAAPRCSFAVQLSLTKMAPRLRVSRPAVAASVAPSRRSRVPNPAPASSSCPVGGLHDELGRHAPGRGAALGQEPAEVPGASVLEAARRASPPPCSRRRRGSGARLRSRAPGVRTGTRRCPRDRRAADPASGPWPRSRSGPRSDRNGRWPRAPSAGDGARASAIRAETRSRSSRRPRWPRWGWPPAASPSGARLTVKSDSWFGSTVTLRAAAG